MNTITAPRFVILQSNTNTTQYYYLVLMDLPPDTAEIKYSNAKNIIPKLNGTDLEYNISDFELPSDYEGTTITYLLTPFSIESNDGIPNITNITFKALKSTKKGDTGGIGSKHLDEGAPPSYILKDRVFVLQSDTNTNTYFVGGLVDYPSTKSIGLPLQLKNTNEYEVGINNVVNPAVTFLAYTQNPASYNSTTKVASIAAIFVNGYNDSEHKGILCFNGVDLYANPMQPDYGSNVNPL